MTRYAAHMSVHTHKNSRQPRAHSRSLHLGSDSLKEAQTETLPDVLLFPPFILSSLTFVPCFPLHSTLNLQLFTPVPYTPLQLRLLTPDQIKNQLSTLMVTLATYCNYKSISMIGAIANHKLAEPVSRQTAEISNKLYQFKSERQCLKNKMETLEK